jgi:hypothetical protein
MNYFVSIGDCYLHQWQIDILIKSFKKLNLLKDLHISLSTNKKFNKPKIEAQNVYFFEDLGKEKDYLKYNKWYTLFNLINNNKIKLPIAVLEPHFLLTNKFSDSIVNSTSNVIYQIDKKFIYNDVYFHKEVFGFKKNKLTDYWLELGDIIIFNNLNANFFLNILNNINKLSLYLEDYKNLDKLSVLASILNNKKSLKIEPRNDIESNLYQNNLNYFINYKYGFKNIFQKNYYKYNINFCGKSIYENLSNIRYTKCLDFFYQIL